ncbi:undecaprenyldiphospho-muramoylpentapeptide beta-N-acetylglucosaminyltransferase [Luteibaculum oceani]|uniref:UDP-N-acetylglucosamine--N-acetylmuramyl-(pentapeptide) pyrophosphoryl-undecaprenol N-acetylglucosamine transferase n=1 Tax=Luteibaculum oceani TaxID=1294296 RepID=A0A5C6V1L2_9FLAO|nr:undecaprenyldiphospho-muramoylpentapeptide beta-N-acetylglucosaminyltransferase [Luteibaculum oceani]TXC78874.1 undecaprenyldiphospho-muramoylpentapeptide beta-N-acetylglucosaminyltransferase [Luteibaculum oceani]
MELRRVIISGGGTGGHIFPAIAIADEIKSQYPQCDILFVGAEGKMEMEKVPKAGYKIEGLNIRGLQRSLSFENLKFPFRVISSLQKAKRIVRSFNPDVAVGVGGYASGPLLFVASKMGVPCVLQEQNSFAGLTNKLLAKRVAKVCTAYDEAANFFPDGIAIQTGNPVRKQLKTELTRDSAKEALGMDPKKQMVLVVGGSLGAGAINELLLEEFGGITDANLCLFWQTGKIFWNKHAAELQKLSEHNHSLRIEEFIEDMATAYAAADIVVSRAGAIAISELQYLGKACVFVPSPFVAENHQLKNAQALINKNAAVLVEQKEINKLIPEVLKLAQNPEDRVALEVAMKGMAKPNATQDIVKIIAELSHA